MKNNSARGDMYRRFLIAVFLTICIYGCNAPAPEETAPDPNVTPEGIRITPDVVYGHKFGMALTFDIYQPESQNGAGVIWINSGGWQSPIYSLHKQTNEGLRLRRSISWTAQLLNKGFTVFNLRHGSSPKFEMSEIVGDLRRAIRFIRFHAGKYGVDSERLGLFGGSAGGHLSLLLGTTPEIGNSEATEEFEKGSGHIAAIVAYFPPTNLKREVDYFKEINPDILKQFPAVAFLGDEQLKEFSPINHASSDDPPTLIVHGDEDQLVHVTEGELMYEAMGKLGVESKFVKIPGAGHGFRGEEAVQARTEMMSWFEEHLVEK